MNFKYTLYACAFTLMSLSLATVQQARACIGPVPPETPPPPCSATSLAPGQPWTLEYSFGGGIPMPGRGTVHLMLDSNGKAVVTITVYRKPTRTRTVTLPPAAMAKIDTILRESPPACMHTTLRKGYVIVDMGGYMLKFTHAGHTVGAQVDGCHYVDKGGKVFEAIVDGIQGLKPYLGDEITWNSMASMSMKSDACARKPEGK